MHVYRLNLVFILRLFISQISFVFRYLMKLSCDLKLRISIFWLQQIVISFLWITSLQPLFDASCIYIALVMLMLMLNNWISFCPKKKEEQLNFINTSICIYLIVINFIYLVVLAANHINIIQFIVIVTAPTIFVGNVSANSQFVAKKKL